MGVVLLAISHANEHLLAKPASHQSACDEASSAGAAAPVEVIVPPVMIAALASGVTPARPQDDPAAARRGRLRGFLAGRERETQPPGRAQSRFSARQLRKCNRRAL